MKFNFGTYAKALMAFVTAFIGAIATAGHGVDLGSLDIGQWLTGLGAAATAGGATFMIPNKPAGSVVDATVANVTRAADVIQQAQTAAAVIAAKAQEDTQRIQSAVTDLAAKVVATGEDLVDQVINSTKK